MSGQNTIMSRHAVVDYLRMPYARVLVPDEEGRYAAQILEFPGCYSEGESPEEAYGNLEEAARNWIESALEQGMAIPPPSGGHGYSGVISLRLPKSLHKRASHFAHREGVSLNQFLVTAVAMRLGAEDMLTLVASRIDGRLQRLEGPQYVAFQGVMQQRPMASTGSLGTAGDVPNWESKSSALAPNRKLLQAVSEGANVNG